MGLFKFYDKSGQGDMMQISKQIFYREARQANHCKSSELLSETFVAIYIRCQVAVQRGDNPTPT